MTGKPTPPNADEPRPPGDGGAAPLQPPAGVGAQRAAGLPPQAGAKLLTAPPGMPVGAAVMGGPGSAAGSAPPSMKARTAIRRSLPMLRAVRGMVVVSIVLGLIATSLPFLVSAATGPLTALFGRTRGCGGLSHVWSLSASLFSRAGSSDAQELKDTCVGTGGPPTHASGLLGWLATPLPFATLVVIWGGALVLQQVASFGNAWADAQVQWRLLTDIRQRVHDHLQSMSLDFFSGTPSGLLMQRVQMETTGVQQLLSDCLVSPCIDAAVLAVVLVYILALSWPMTLVTLALSPIALMTLAWGGRRLQASTRAMVMSNRRLGGELGETISGISDIQVFDAEKQRSERFFDMNKAAARNSSQMLVWAQVAIESTGVYVALSTVLVLIVGVVFNDTFALPAQTLLQFVFFVPAMFAPVQRIIQSYTKFKSVLPQVASTYHLLDTKPSVQNRSDARVLGNVDGDIVFEDVVFGYRPNQKVLDGLNLSIRTGETVALVGAIGCGKSTMMNLLLRFLDPERGRILLDGHNVGEVTLASLRGQVSKLAQFPFYLKDTIRENVRMGRRDATDAEIEEACTHALIHWDIIDPAKMPNGYDTVMDVQVPSGGQKRLIALARCLLRKPEVLLLDEPTENLDAHERLALTQVIRDYARDRTCVVISHDMDFITAVADRIIVLDGGVVVEDGTHEELMAKDGLYKRLNDAQNVDPSLVRRGASPPEAHMGPPAGVGADAAGHGAG